jgi:2-oxoglutarate ferredoxin oxidoreductase subunit beta
MNEIMTNTLINTPTLTKRDFETSQEVRWCPGCGDYAILASMQKVLSTLNILQEKMAIISGIGCSSRFPYYMNTYGFHTIHGRAPTIATGLSISRPDLTLMVVTGDGDGLSIGANHLLHLMRRNVNVTVLLFNNRIYGLTKGQTSPTSEFGKTTKSSPQGTQEPPLEALQLALASDCSFIGRAIDVDGPNLQKVLAAAIAHQGTSLVEIYQNCNVFNDGAFNDISDRRVRAEHTVFAEPNQPLVYGNARHLGLALVDQHFQSITLADSAMSPYLHRGDACSSILWKLTQLQRPDFPVVTGILRQVQRPTYAELVAQAQPCKTEPAQLNDLTQLLHSGHTWEVK